VRESQRLLAVVAHAQARLAVIINDFPPPRCETVPFHLSIDKLLEVGLPLMQTTQMLRRRRPWPLRSQLSFTMLIIA